MAFSEGLTCIGFGFDTCDESAEPIAKDWQVDFSSIVITTTAIPEPASLTLLALAGALVLTRKRR